MHQTLSIISSVRNCLEETKGFLRSLEQFPIPCLSEVILIDDGSHRETQEFLEKQQNRVRLFRNPQSRGFAYSNNLGAENTRSDWILFMNNDLVLQADWEKPFCQIIEKKKEIPDLGCLGNIQFDPRTNAIDHAGISFEKGHPSHFLHGEQVTPSVDFSEYIAVTGACFLIRKNVFFKIGGFDEKYKTGFEDIDLCLRLKMLGYRHFVSNKSRILHKRSSTPERNDHQSYNSRVFYGRWGKIITRLEEWERKSRTNQSSAKRERNLYITQNPESFLFADRTLLINNFDLFLKHRHFDSAEKVFSLFKENFHDDRELPLLNLRLLRKQGKHQQALKILNSAAGRYKKKFPFLWEKAQIANALGEIPKSRRIFHTLAKRGFIPGVCFQQIGECYLEEKKFEDAKKYYKKALVHLPDSFRIWNRLGKVHQELGEKSHEIKVLQKSLSLNPQNSSTFLTLFKSLVGIGSWTKAYQLCIRSKEIQVPVEYLLDFSKACIESGDIKSAIIALNKLISKRHDVAEAYFLKGNVMVLLKEFPKAVECYRKALDYREDWPEALSNLYNSKTFLCDWSDREKEIKHLQAFHESDEILGGAFELAGLYWSEEEESKYARIRSDRIVAERETTRRRLNFDYKPQERNKKRIGFLSSDFRNHAVGHQIIALFENLDSEKYELFIYATSPSEDSAVRKRIENISKNFKNLSSFSLVNKAIAIHRDELDLLVDLGGFSRGHNAQLLALRPAVKQAHYLGYASSMGAEFVDYMIADELVLPGSSNKNYQENILRMQGCFFPPGDFQGFAKRVKRKEVGLPSRGIVYCAFHAAYKLDPDIWACWMRILKAVPESVLWLKFKPAEDAMKNLKAEAVRLGVSSKRIILAEDLPDRETHLSRMAVADLYLDCPLYNGHASAMDALHAKVPILTVKGNRFCNRVGESFCKNLDLQEMICKDLRKYEEKAIELGLRPSKLLPLRKKIHENADAVLCPVEHTKRFEVSLDGVLAKSTKPRKKNRRTVQEKKQTVSKPADLPLKDFTLVMIRPPEITNWAGNVSMLADELAKWGGATIVIESPTAQSKKSDFSKSVKVLFCSEESFSQAINQAICEADSKYIFYLDDPLRVLPVAHFIETMKTAMDALRQGKVGILGVCSSMEPHTGCLVTKSADTKKQNVKVAGFFSPSFVLNLDAVQHTGGLRNFSDSMALSVLDMSLRLEGEGYRNSLIETDRIICPAHSGKEYLSQSSKSELSRFLKLWKSQPISLKPKYPPKDEQVGETADYQEWIRLSDTITEGDILAFRKEADDLNHKPLISVIMPVFNPPKKFLIKAIESVISQAYENWELCVADDASTKKYIRPLLESYANKDPRIKVTFRKTNGHISVASNSAIKLATGQFVAFLDHDDELRPHSLLEVAKVINQHPDAKLIYSDEDIIDHANSRIVPHFKADWDPCLILGHNYICHLMTLSLKEVKKLGGFRKHTEGAQDWDLVLRIIEKIDKSAIFHIEKILYHWRRHQNSTSETLKCKPYILNNSKKILEDRLSRIGEVGRISPIDSENSIWSYDKELKKTPSVSIIIPIKDKLSLLRSCLNSLMNQHNRKNYEVIIINNNSVEPETLAFLDSLKRKRNFQVLNINSEFNFSKLNNTASKNAKGEYILFLNNDVEAINANSIDRMTILCSSENAGLVGAKLLYPDKSVQHAGVFVGINNSAGHMFKGMNGDNGGYMHTLFLERNVTACTAACLMIKKEIFLSSGGFDESLLKVAFNDVDLSLRIRKRGLQNILSSRSLFYHHESSTRGYDCDNAVNKNRMFKESTRLNNKWNLKTYRDNFYSTNFSRTSENLFFSIKKSQLKVQNVNYQDYQRGSRNYKKTWTQLAQSYGTAVAHVSGHHSEKELDELGHHTVTQLKNCFKINSTDTILEIGCGIGRVGKILSKICKKWIGCDISPKMIEFAKLRLRGIKNIDLVELKLPDLSQFQDSSVDVVYCTVVFMHLDEWDRYKYVKEAFRILKPGGRLYVDNFNLNSDEGWKLFISHCEIDPLERNPAISVSSTPQELKIFLKRVGLKKVTTKESGLWTWAYGFKQIVKDPS